MTILEIQDKEIWNKAVNYSEQSQLLLSWEWGEFQKSMGKKVLRFGCFNEKNEIVGVFPVIKNNIPFNLSYLYSPRSPLMVSRKEFNTVEFTNFVSDLCKEENSFFWKADFLDNIQAQEPRFKRVEDLQPRKTLMLDIFKSEDELQAGMHNKTRYNIRVAKKHNVEIVKESDDIQPFMDLLKVTTERDRFNGHPDSYYSKLLELKDFAKLSYAKYNGKVIAGNLMIYFGDTVTYLHGVSSNEDRNVMAPYLLHWDLITDAKEKGYHYYDFWGINEDKWPGVTAFKRKFVSLKNGLEVDYPGTYDLVSDKLKYNLYRIYRKFS